MRFIALVHQHYQELNNTDLIMSQYVADHPKLITKMSTLEFSKECHYSKSSVIRFSQKLGFTGFSELRNFLKWQEDEDLFEKDLTFKNMIYQSIDQTIAYNETASWEPIYEKITRSDRIFVMSTGVTQHSQADEFIRLFLLIGKMVQSIPASSQSNEFKRIVENLKENDMIFVFSLSGENSHLENVLNTLSIRHAIVVSVTSLQNNWLSKRADYNLYAATNRSPIPKDWWLQTASSFFVLIELFAFGYVDYLKLNEKK